MPKHNSLQVKAIKAVIYNMGSFIANISFGFLISIVLARLLTPSDYGLLGMVTIFIAISQLFIDSGMSSALIREKNPSEDDYSTVFFYNLFISLSLYTLLYVIAPLIARFFSEPQLVDIIRVIGLSLIINSFGLIQRTMLIRKIDFKSQAYIEVSSVMIAGMIAIFMAYKGLGVWALISQSLVKHLITSSFFVMKNRWTPKFRFSRDSFNRLFGFGWKLLLTGVLATLYKNIYNIIIGRSYTSVELGYYTKSLHTRDLASNSITTVVEKVSYPILSRIQDDKTKLQSTFKKIIKLCSFTTFPLMIGLAIVANQFIPLLFGEQWSKMIPYFQILCFAGITFPHRAINLNLLKVVGRSDLFLKLDILKITVGIVSIGLVIILKLGVYGLLWCSFFNTQFAFFVNTLFSKKYIGYSTSQQVMDIIPLLIISLVMGGGVYLFAANLNFNVITNLIIEIVFGIVFYLSACWLLKIEALQIAIEAIRTLRNSHKMR